MSREEGKHRDELFRVTPILKELGYTPNENMCGDAPDILIPSVEKRNIGIEVVSYSTGQNEKAQNALRKVLDEYAGILDRKSDKRFEIGTGLLRQGLPNFTKEKHKGSKWYVAPGSYWLYNERLLSEIYDETYPVED